VGIKSRMECNWVKIRKKLDLRDQSCELANARFHVLTIKYITRELKYRVRDQPQPNSGLLQFCFVVVMCFVENSV
jgi:hypothetical protein